MISTEQQLAYAAGIIDGEGCVNIAKQPGETIRGYSLVMRVVVTNCSKALIDFLVRTFGGRIYHYVSKGKRKEYWKWYLFTSNAANFLGTIMPYLIVKRQEAQLAIEFQQTKCSRKCGKLSADELAFDELCFQKMRALKHEEAKNYSNMV